MKSQLITIALLSASILSNVASAHDEDIATEVANSVQSSHSQEQKTFNAYDSTHNQESYAGEDQATIALNNSQNFNLTKQLTAKLISNTEFSQYLNTLEDKATNVASYN